MIPKIIHYCWFGEEPLSKETENYIRTWQTCCPGYEIRRWDESNFDMQGSAYAREAFEVKKWAFLADYVRLKVLSEFGGIYLDTDVELLKGFDSFLEDSAFCGYENEKTLCTAIMGSEPHGVWVDTLLERYQGRHFLLQDGSFDETTNVTVVSEQTEKILGVSLNGKKYRKDKVLTIYPRDWFSPMSFDTGRMEKTDHTVAVHHFIASWHDETWHRERAVRYRCIRLLGENLGNRAANAVNFARRRDGSFSQGVKYYLTQPWIWMSSHLPPGQAVVFETEGDFADNGRALFEYLLEEGKNRCWRLIWLVQNPERYEQWQYPHVLFLKKGSLRARYQISRARFFFFTHPWWMKTWGKGRTVINLWHGIPLKRGDGTDRHALFDFLVASSPDTLELFQKFIGVQQDQFLPLGQPRLDLLLRQRPLDGLLKGYIRGNNYEKLIVCMPTFRQTSRWTDGTFSNVYSINPVKNLEQLEELNTYLQTHGMLMVVKIHHLQKLDFLERTSLSHIFYLMDEDFLSENLQLYELLGQADALLTDYSSVYFDFLTLDRPIGFFVGDMEQYTRGFLVDNPTEWMPGEKIVTIEELYSFLGDLYKGKDQYAEQRRTLCDRVDIYQDNHNCQRIAEHFGL